MKKESQKQLGDVLVDVKLITPENLTEALKVQKAKGGLIGQILVAMKFTTEQAIAQALTAQYGFPYLPLAGYEADPDVVKKIPEAVCRQYCLVAVDEIANVLTVAMANPLNRQAIEDIEMMTQHKIQVFVTTATDVDGALKRVFKT